MLTSLITEDLLTLSLYTAAKLPSLSMMLMVTESGMMLWGQQLYTPPSSLPTDLI